jgi:hypothetical protein
MKELSSLPAAEISKWNFLRISVSMESVRRGVAETDCLSLETDGNHTLSLETTSVMVGLSMAAFSTQFMARSTTLCRELPSY